MDAGVANDEYANMQIESCSDDLMRRPSLMTSTSVCDEDVFEILFKPFTQTIHNKKKPITSMSFDISISKPFIQSVLFSPLDDLTSQTAIA
jgi:hypothetical protein